MDKNKARKAIENAMNKIGFDLMDGNYPDNGNYTEMYRTEGKDGENLDVLIEIVQHTDGL